MRERDHNYWITKKLSSTFLNTNLTRVEVAEPTNDFLLVEIPRRRLQSSNGLHLSEEVEGIVSGDCDIC